MAEVPNHKIVERYKNLLANRTHDVILQDLALEVAEEELRDLKQKQQMTLEENETLKRRLETVSEKLKKEQSTPAKTIQGEVVKTEGETE